MCLPSFNFYDNSGHNLALEANTKNAINFSLKKFDSWKPLNVLTSKFV